MKRRRVVWLVLLLLALTMLVQAAAQFAGVGLFFHFFYARYDTLCPTDLTVRDLAADVEPVSFLSDGDTLSGLILKGGQNGVIVIVHGLNSGMDAHFAEADWFAARGYTVFTFDGRGTRTSGGRSRDSVSASRDDLNAALDYLATTAYSSLPVYLYGHSSGGYAVAATADRAAATVAIAAFDAPVDLMCDTAARYAGFFAYLQKPYLALWNRIEAGADANERASDLLNRSGASILIVAAEDDTVIPASCALYARQDEVFDPHAVFVSYPGEHSEVWLSESAISYRAEADRQGEVDRLLYNEVNEEFLAAVLAFFRDAK